MGARQPVLPGRRPVLAVERRQCIPIGNLTSQFFGNVYFDPLDHHLADRLRCGRYLRYVDDFRCFADDKAR